MRFPFVVQNQRRKKARADQRTAEVVLNVTEDAHLLGVRDAMRVVEVDGGVTKTKVTEGISLRHAECRRRRAVAIQGFVPNAGPR